MTDIAYQLYSSRKFPPLADTLAMLTRLGYAAVEGYGALYADPAKVEELKAHLGATGLRMPTGHFGLDMIEGDPDGVIAIGRALGVETVFCPHIAADARPDTGAGWEAFGRRLAEAGKPIRDAGFDLGWHNHDFEFIPLDDGAIPQAALFAGAPDLLWEADLAWVVRAGADPVAAVGEFADRLVAAHLKDIAPAGQATGEDGWADLGAGVVDWLALIPALKAAGCRYWVLEHDNPSDDARFAQASFVAARSLIDGE